MNKKFSTLVASVLLATGSMAFTVPAQAAVSSDQVAVGSKYEAGKGYLLKIGSGYLTVDGNKKSGSYTLVVKDNIEEGLNIKKSLWEVKVIPAEAGSISSKFILTNRYTGTVLALDKSKAFDETKGTWTAGCSVLGGDLVEWTGSVVGSTVSANNALYAPYATDKVVVLRVSNADGDAANGLEVYPVIIKASEIPADGSNVVTLTPYKSTDVIYLTPNDLNTQFGENGIQGSDNNLIATKDSYFNLNTVVSEGQMNFFGTDLQARAVQQWELQYGEEDVIVGNGDALVDDMNATNAFASLYAENNISLDSKANIGKAKNNEKLVAYKNTEAKIFALYSKTNDKYVVVDTTFYNGTEQAKNQKVKFAYDGLYNAKNDTRYRLPQSYLFKFKYNATDNTVTVESVGHMAANTNQTDKNWVKVGTELSDFYNATTPAEGYKTGAVKAGSYYPNRLVAADAATKQTEMAGALDAANIYIDYAELVNTKVLTLSDNVNSAIKVGLQSEYQLAYLAPGVYTFKVTGSKNPDVVGKYWTMTLGGNSQYVEQAPRQDFQNMPAAQWVVESLGSSSYTSPIKTTNREFEEAFGSEFINNNVATSGLIYKGGADNRIFFFGGDTLEYTKVAKANDAHLGYKYMTKDEMKESVYTFNFLHELAMDKPINTINEKDSALWVDKNGSAMKFQLEEVIEDGYGYNAGSKSIANLVRKVYKIRVKDASKLQNDNRYLTYNATSKKYYVTNSVGNAKNFFLKENNTLEDGTPYYTLVVANLVDVALVALDVDGDIVPTAVTSYEVRVNDNDLENVVKDGVTYGYAYCSTTQEGGLGLTDPETGLPVEGYSVYELISKFTEIANSNYAYDKVAVDNNTLALVNGVLNDINYAEVNNSAFAVKKDDSKLYRTIGDAQGEVKNGSNVLNFFRVNATEKEYLYEDANSVYSKDLGLNFLGVEGKGDTKNRAMLVTYTHGDFMPQYLIALDTTVVEGTEELCDICGKLDCEHSKTTRGYIDGRFLVNLSDSINAYTGAVAKSKFQLGREYTRLAFVDARLQGDSLIIKNSVYTGNNKQVKPSEARTWAANDTIDLAPNKHNQALFQFRLINDSNDFMMESESWANGKPFAGDKAPKNEGGWVKIQNGVPVIIKATLEEAYRNAEIFNVELTDKAPVSVEDADAATVSIEGGYATVTVKNAEGEKVVIYNALGAKLVEAIATSDNAAFTVSAKGVVMVKAGDASQSVIVK